jgi:molybdopterin converting factor small subunit
MVFSSPDVRSLPHGLARCAADGYLTRRMAAAPDVTVRVPPALRGCCEGVTSLSLSAASIRAVLDQVEQRYPALHRSICDETGSVRRHINLFVNAAHVRDRGGLDTVLTPGDVVTILPSVSGG